MITAEIYKFEDNRRMVETNEFDNQELLNKHLLLLKLRGTWVGHKIYNTTMEQYMMFTDVQKANAVVEQKFDKEAYLESKHPQMRKFKKPAPSAEDILGAIRKHKKQ